jgi:hypothetical protein
MSDRTVWVARVTRKGSGKDSYVLDAKMNPALSATERTHLACKCAEMFAKLGAEGVVGLSDELAKAVVKPRVLRP